MQRLAFIVVGSLGLLTATTSLGHAKAVAARQPTPPVDSFSLPPAAGMSPAPSLPLAYTPEGEAVIITPAATALGNLTGTDRAFIEHYILATNGDLSLAKIALQRASQTETRDLARRIIRDESNAILALRTLIEPRGVQVSSAWSQGYQAERDRLLKSSGARFDKEYLQGQLQHHVTTVNLLRVYAEQGHDALLHSWTLRQVPTFERHLQTLRELLGLRSSGV